MATTLCGRAAAALMVLGLLSCCAHAAVGDGHHEVPIMPFGDSITTCCHSCSVPAAILPPDAKAAHTEPIQPYQGYMRPLWHLLWRLPSALDRRALNFSFVGRMRDCLFPHVRNGTRARTDDWPVRYEAYYGYTAMRLVKEGLAVSAVAAAVAGGATPPLFTLLHVGTNDLLAVRTSNRIGGAIEGIRHLVGSLAFGAAGAALLAPRDNATTSVRPAPPVTTSPSSPFCKLVSQTRRRRRAIVLSLPIPVQFGLVGMGAAGKSYAARAKRWRRHAQLVAAIEELFHELTGLRAVGNRDTASFVRALAPLRVDPARFRNALSACDGEQRGSSPAAPSAADATDGGVDLVLVDQAAGFRTDADLHGDGVHPAGPGEGKIAARYAAGIQAALAAWGLLPPDTRVPDATLDAWAARVVAASTVAPLREDVNEVPPAVPRKPVADSTQAVTLDDEGIAPPLLLSAPSVLLLASAGGFVCCVLRRRLAGGRSATPV